MTQSPPNPERPTEEIVPSPSAVLVCARIMKLGGVSRLARETRIKRCKECNSAVAVATESVALLAKRPTMPIWCEECANARLIELGLTKGDIKLTLIASDTTKTETTDA